jgi:hypothetical protein
MQMQPSLDACSQGRTKRCEQRMRAVISSFVGCCTHKDAYCIAHLSDLEEAQRESPHKCCRYTSLFECHIPSSIMLSWHSCIIIMISLEISSGDIKLLCCSVGSVANFSLAHTFIANSSSSSKGKCL